MTEEMEVKSSDTDYISEVCDFDREGLRHLGHQLLSLLDWRSLVRLKRACPQVWFFLQQVPSLEKRALAEKLAKDWGSGSPRAKKTLPPPSKEVTSTLQAPCHEVLAAKVLPGGNVLVSTEAGLHMLPEGRIFLTGQEEAKPEKPMSSRSQQSEIRHFDLLNNWIVAGGSDGVLSVWDETTTKLLSSRQLFGMITGLRCIPEEQLVATGHASKAYDCGVISLRKMISSTETEVVWSATHDVMPIFCFDINTRWLVSLEWLGSFNSTPVGSTSVYSRQGVLYNRRDLGSVRAVESRRSVLGLQSTALRFTAAALLQEDFLVLALEYDGTGRASIEVWELTSLAPLLRLPGHTHSIHQLTVAGDLLMSRDKERNVSIWDARELKTDDKAAENFLNKPNTQFPLLHFLRVQEEASHGTNIDCRHLVMASPYGVVLMDFWDAADPQNKNGTRKGEKGEIDAEENKNLGVTAKSGSIGALIQQMADFKQTLEFGGNQNQNT